MLMGVRWYVAYPFIYRHVEELMEERGVPVDHATIGYLAFPVCLWHNGYNVDGAYGQRACICRGWTEGEGSRAAVYDAITGRGGHRPGAISGTRALDRECGQRVWVYPAVQGLTSAAREVCRTGVCGVRVSLQSVRPAGAWLRSPDCHVL